MIVEAVLFLHILGGLLAIISGYAALLARKGGPLHRRAGVLFVYSMLVMGVGAAVVGLARGLPTWLGGPVTVYFVITALRTVRRGSRPNLLVDGGLLVMAVLTGLASLLGGNLVFAVLLLAAAAGDARVLRRGPLTGNARLARHLWRMCFATFIATGSFFLGQIKVIPEPLRIMPVLIVLAVLPLAFLLFWLWRVRWGRDPLPALGGLTEVHQRRAVIATAQLLRD
jgi:hypothetical protein